MSTTTEQVITPDIIDEAMSYEEYRTMIDNLLDDDKTTGTNHSDAMVRYTRMNVHRMDRLDKRTEINDKLLEELNHVETGWIWLVLTEAWCGDAAQNVPVIAKMAQQSDRIDLKLILRDQHPEIMDQYLTNGGRSIPKLVCLDADALEEIGTWGPRPEKAQEKAMEWKENSDISKKEWAKKLHKWYADNKTRELQSEFEELIPRWQEN